MKPEDVEFVRSQASHNRPDIQRLLSLLFESEAMREKAEFWRLRFQRRSPTPERVGWSDADWIDAKKKELGI